MSLIKVLTEVENQSTKSLPAKIVSKNGEEFTIKYLSPTTKRDQRNRRIYSYEDETYVITDESVTEYTETDSELYFGFKEIAIGEFIKYDSDDEDEDFELEAEEEEEEDDEEEDEDLEEELDEDFDEE
jgi:hypothetical protein